MTNERLCRQVDRVCRGFYPRWVGFWLVRLGGWRGDDIAFRALVSLERSVRWRNRFMDECLNGRQINHRARIVCITTIIIGGWLW